MDKHLEEALENCANEPIEFPDSIQPHGVLIVLNDELQVLRVSQNTDEFISHPAKILLDKSLKSFFDLPESCFSHQYQKKIK